MTNQEHKKGKEETAATKWVAYGTTFFLGLSAIICSASTEPRLLVITVPATGVGMGLVYLGSKKQR